MSQLVAVIDLGKTNKKIVLFDRKLQVITARQANFPAKMGPDGMLVEQIEAIWLWLTRELQALYRTHRFHALSVTTHGATFAALDQTGRPCLPVIAYEHDLGPAGQAGLDEDFYRLCGSPTALQEETGTCDMPLLVNAAKAIRFAQRRLPGQWARVRHLLDYPQFWGYLLTGEKASEPTYTANHSFLFNPRTRGPSSAAKALGADGLIDWKLRSPWERLGVLRGDLQRELGLPALPVTVGIHDSNAALLPYLIKFGERDFVLNSTGTWCVAMHKVSEVAYREDELGRKIIFNIDALGNFQKVSFLMGGMDYALYHDGIGGQDPGYDVTRLGNSLAHPERCFLPGAFPSQFSSVRGGVRDGAKVYSVEQLKAGRKPAWFTDRDASHDLLNVSLALQSEVALRRTDIRDGTTIFVEGGFRNNPTFLAVLAAVFPKNPIAITNLAQASAAGAALLGHALLSHIHPKSLASSISIETEDVPRPSIPQLAAYRTAWLAAANGTPLPAPAVKAPSASVAAPMPAAKSVPAKKSATPAVATATVPSAGKVPAKSAVIPSKTPVKAAAKRTSPTPALASPAKPVAQAAPASRATAPVKKAAAGRVVKEIAPAAPSAASAASKAAAKTAPKAAAKTTVKAPTKVTAKTAATPAANKSTAQIPAQAQAKPKVTAKASVKAKPASVAKKPAGRSR